MVLGSTQPQTKMSNRNLCGGKERSAPKADLTTIFEPIIYKMWEPRCLTTLWTYLTCYRNSFTFYLTLRAGMQKILK
jgi:hypothetical protein